MTDKPQPDKFDWATELSDAQGHVTLSAQEAKEIGARLRSMRVKLKTYEDFGDAGSDVQLLRTGYAAARLEIESLKSQLAAEPPAPRGEPVAWLNPWRADQVTTDYDAYGKHGIPLYTAPQPLPAAQGDALDAARYRWLAASCRSTSEHWGGRWSIIIDGPAPKSHDSEDDFDAAIDAARAAQEGK